MKKLIRALACLSLSLLPFSAQANIPNNVFGNSLRQTKPNLLSDFGIDPTREPWFAELMQEGSEILNGNFVDQDRVAAMALRSNRYSLVSQVPVQNGPQLLFASYLLDTVSGRAFDFLSRSEDTGRDSIEDLFKSQLNSPLNFDAIFSNFLTYIYQAAGNIQKLPLSFGAEGAGIAVPAFTPIAILHSLPANFQGTLAPYSFATIQLDQELPASAVVNISLVSGPSCDEGFSVLWKPISPKTLAVYSTGCAQQSLQDTIVFRLSITD